MLTKNKPSTLGRNVDNIRLKVFVSAYHVPGPKLAVGELPVLHPDKNIIVAKFQSIADAMSVVHFCRMSHCRMSHYRVTKYVDPTSCGNCASMRYDVAVSIRQLSPIVLG